MATPKHTGPVRPLHVIAGDIRAAAREARPGVPWVTYSAPYVTALAALRTVDDYYGQDDGRMTVTYLLSNLSGWRGAIAREIKAELRAHLDGAPVEGVEPSTAGPESLTDDRAREILRAALDAGVVRIVHVGGR
jgi:hypothetical protein